MSQQKVLTEMSYLDEPIISNSTSNSVLRRLVRVSLLRCTQSFLCSAPPLVYPLLLFYFWNTVFLKEVAKCSTYVKYETHTWCTGCISLASDPMMDVLSCCDNTHLDIVL